MVESSVLIKCIKNFVAENDDIGKQLLKTIDIKKFSKENIENLYVHLAEYLLNPSYTKLLVKHFCNDVLNILHTAIDIKSCHLLHHEAILNNVLVFSDLLYLCPDSKGFIIKYFMSAPSPFAVTTKGSFRKHKKGNEAPNVPADKDLAIAYYKLLKYQPEFFKLQWNWSKFFEKFLMHKEPMVLFISYQCMAIYSGMSEKSLNSCLKSQLPEEQLMNCRIELSKLFENSLPNCEDHSITEGQSNSSVVCVAGINLPVLGEQVHFKQLLEVPTTQSNLHKVALGVAINKAVNLLGPVGSGKTSIVEYLALKTGHKFGENFIKVQLGDQTDSKMLLGTYQCTDIPGEFIWQPGVLTQAVLDGSWLLLEDVDSASMDIASVISGLLENQYLTVPGFRDCIPAAPGFQLFLTERLSYANNGMLVKRFSHSASLLEKHVLNVNIQPLPREELSEIIAKLYPNLETICSRMVDVFFTFQQGKFERLPKGARQTSTRDLFKWCARATVDFNVASQSSALKVLQDGIDIFCCSFFQTEERLLWAQEISSRLGIISEKAAYFCQMYKPTLALRENYLEAGRGRIYFEEFAVGPKITTGKFCFTRPAACLLERILCCVAQREPVLLVGETGTGKTSTVQFIANTIGQKLVVINMNQQSDSADLLGGYKPVDMKFIIGPIKKQYETLFCSYFNPEANRKFLGHLNRCFNEKQFVTLLKLMQKSQMAAMNRLEKSAVGQKRKVSSEESSELEMKNKWSKLGEKLEKLEHQLKNRCALSFAFIEGSLVKAIEGGFWVLLDEINLANAETLECLSGLLEGSKGTLSLLERGDKKPITRHPNFTLFSCMNPSTDVGKKDLPVGLRNRFTEFFVEELTDKNDLLLLISNYLEAMCLSAEKLEDIVRFYTVLRKEAETRLGDGLGHKPHFSLRSLCRALTIASGNPCGTFTRSLYEAFCLSFLTQLDGPSYKAVKSLIAKYIVGKDIKAVLNRPIPQPGDEYIQFEGYWLQNGPLESLIAPEYILTESVKRNLKDLVRVVAIGKLPVLLQGDTSVGKTSLIIYLAKAAGYKCVRINNHEHTDLQEYVGSYVATEDGQLQFAEGPLAQAMREGYWIILDELNLAPSDVLEALNRVLDDNRELFIPETQETIKAHANFMLFATQNPPGTYGGRKVLSRAFRNRFVELHFNEIPHLELEYILNKRCQMPQSYAAKMIKTMKELQTRRRGSAAFAGKHGFITLRDLFRWGERYRMAKNVSYLYDWDQHLTDEGYLLLAGRVRKPEEKKEIAQVLKKYMNRTVDPENLYTLGSKTSPVTKEILEELYKNAPNYESIVWTYNMRQLYVLVRKAMHFKEPILLVGETGGGKTTICDILAKNNGQNLLTVNCHMHTESSDFIGALRPVRDHSDDLNKLFEWVYGPLVEAMLKGHLFLADEISLADDSVLERLNSLLEPERTLLIAEKGFDSSEVIKADDKFHFVGTMNPGGDFGKKELSPALRNRFTEIWCEPCTRREDFIDIIKQNLLCKSTNVPKNIMDFIEWFKCQDIGKRFTISIRDILTWTTFINACFEDIGVEKSYQHGAYLTFLDSLGSGVTSGENPQSLLKFQNHCSDFLSRQTMLKLLQNVQELKVQSEDLENKFGIYPFFIQMGENRTDYGEHYTFEAPTTIQNALRLLRGLQLKKALLLEGSPGVGKTSLVTALAKATRHKVLRINLSDQTDISDLFGADLPVEGGSAGQFSWRDGPLLQALRNGHWVLLDELNLASQSVLEGLNACLDHRGEIFVPELGKTFIVKPGTRFFGCQNPLKQGGSRRGLPQSFLNRFTQVYLQDLNELDMLFILTNQFPQIPFEILQKMIKFNKTVNEQLVECNSFGNRGAPWEFNLRDLTRWCQATIYHRTSEEEPFSPESLVGLLYVDRMRTKDDKAKMGQLFKEVFEKDLAGQGPTCLVNEECVLLGDAKIARNTGQKCNWSVVKQEESFLVLRNQLSVLRSLAYCVNLNWMTILVGPQSSGKSSVVKTLAQLCGRTLKTLAVTSAMDTTDILGGFEQADYTRHLEDLSRWAEELTLSTISNLLLAVERREDNGEEVLQCMRAWEKFMAVFRGSDPLLVGNAGVEGGKVLSEEKKRFAEKVSALLELLECLLLRNHSSDDSSQQQQKQGQQLQDRRHRLLSLQQKGLALLNRVQAEATLNAGGRFEWVDSILIKCLKEGSWLLIDNVNLCSPAVLDRLNALLEPNGVLTIGERGVDAEGNMVTLRPHRDFRLFISMDPKNGEISRAMRNRGVEIFLLNDVNERASVLDRRALIARQGLKDENLVKTLMNLHEFITQSMLGETKPNTNELSQSAFLITQQLLRGIPTKKAFETAILDVYLGIKHDTEFALEAPRESLKEKIAELLAGTKTADQRTLACVTLETARLQNDSMLAHIGQHEQLLIRPLESMQMDLDHFNFLHYFALATRDDCPLRIRYLGDTLWSTDFQRTLLERNTSDMCDRHLHFAKEIRSSAAAESNRLFFMLYYKFQLQQMRDELRELRAAKSKKSFSLVQYLLRVKNNDDPVLKEILSIFDAYDSAILEAANSKDLHNDALVLALSLVSFRFRFYQFLKVRLSIVKDIERYLSNVHVHYKWFIKNSIRKMFTLLSHKADGLMQQIENVNGALVQHFSLIRKIGKRYGKFVVAPPPLTSEEQLQVVPVLREFINRNDCKMDWNFKEGLFEIKSQLSFQCQEMPTVYHSLKSLADNNSDDLKDAKDIDLIKEYLNVVNVLQNRTNCENLMDNSLTPANLRGLFALLSTDNRFICETQTEVLQYMDCNLAMHPKKVLGEECQETNLHTATLSNVLSEILQFCAEKGCSLGSYRETNDKLNQIKQLLFGNYQQISDASFLNYEVKYLQDQLEEFFDNFCKTLNVNKPTLEEFQQVIVNFEKSCEESKILLDFLERILKAEKELKTSAEENHTWDAVANTYMILGYFKVLLSAKLPHIDPLSKVSMKKTARKSELNQFEAWKLSLVQINDTLSGNSHGLHPLHADIEVHCQKIQKEINELNSYVAFRPDESEYQKLVKVTYNAFSTILAPAKVLELYDSLNDTKDLKLSEQRLKLARALQTTYDNFTKSLQHYRYTYPDIVEPILSDWMLFLHGFRTKLSLKEKLLLGQKRHNVHVELKKLFSITYGDSKASSDAFESSEEQYQVLKSALLEVCNVCTHTLRYSQRFDAELFGRLNDIVEKFVGAWKTHQSDEERKKSEEESLYKIKTKCDDKPEEEQIEEEFKTLFVSYHEKDFHDLLEKDLTDDEEMLVAVEDFSNVIKEEDVLLIAKIHTEFMVSFTQTEWQRFDVSKKALNIDLIPLTMKKFHLFCKVFKQNVEVLSCNLDRDLLASFCVLLHFMQHTMNNSEALDEIGNIAKYNFYKHSNVAEVKSSFHLLKELQSRIQELLGQWPDHPTLQNINTIIVRMLNFDVTSPLPRFLTGLDILLTKCHEWEENAHSGVSLSLHFAAISHQMIAWRKLEMVHWKSSLDLVTDKLTEASYKHWHYLYDVMTEFIDVKAFQKVDLLNTLQKFVANSNLIEFSVRLKILNAFHCHATFLEPSLQRDMFISVLWNVCKYYEQFLPNIETQIKNIKSPIEKKLKDYVKIVRWKDITYWALKETLEKTHKTIFKFMREFETGLKQPALPFLVNTTGSQKKKNLKSLDFCSISPEKYIITYNSLQDDLIKDNSKLLKKPTVYFKKMQSLCQNVVKLSSLSKNIKHLDDFITEVLETSQYLQNLQVDRTLEKKKQVSQAKGHLQQKQRALSDLLKALGKIGLSAPRGLIESRLKEPNLEFLIKPIDLKVILSYLEPKDQDQYLIEAWSGAESYYVKSLMRLQVLKTALQNPAKDLGLQNGQKIQGYSQHLINISSSQKMKLRDSLNQLYHLRYIEMILANSYDKRDYFFIETEKVCAFRKTLIKLQWICDEFKIFFESFASCENKDFEITKRFECAQHNFNELAVRITDLLKVIKDTLGKYEIPDFENNLKRPKYINLGEKDVVFKVTTDGIIWSLQIIKENLGDLPLMDSIKKLKSKVVEFGDIFTLHKPPTRVSFNKNEFLSNIKNVITIILTSINSISEQHLKDLEDKMTKEEVFELIKDDQLSHLIVSNVNEAIFNLRPGNILEKLQNIMQPICELNLMENKEVCDGLSIVYPFVQQFNVFYKFFITQLVSSYRMSCKMTSIFLNIFIDLATKGFCVPSDLEEEMKEGESKSSGGLGLGDGQGEKDVSDRIESEDQLEDAQPAGQEQQQEEDKDCKEESKGIEMSEDFDSKLQDLEKSLEEEDEDENSDENDSDAEEQMGDTEEGADQQQKQTWGSDEEEAEEVEEQKKEEKGDGGEDLGDKEMSAKDDQSAQPEEETEKKDKSSNKQQEINEMDEPELDDEQTDPYHGNQPELPEPEPMDLPEDLQLDSDGEKEDQNNDENPFDIDAMKEDQIPPDQPDTTEEDKPQETTEEEKHEASDSEESNQDELEPLEIDTDENNDEDDKDNKIESKDVEDGDEKENEEETNQSVFDQTQTKDSTAQADDANDATASDNVQLNESKQDKTNPMQEDTVPEENPDKEGVGQSQMDDSKTGHKGQANADQKSDNQMENEENKKRQRPGETDSNRTLGDAKLPAKKRMKTIDSDKNEENCQNSDEEPMPEQMADAYKHIKDAKENAQQMMDAVDKDQAENLTNGEENKEIPDDETEDILEDVIDVSSDEAEEVDSLKQKAERVDSEKKKLGTDFSENKEKDYDQDNKMEVEGDIVETHTVPRGAESSYHTLHQNYEEGNYQLSIQEINSIRSDVETQLSTWNQIPCDVEAEQTWEKISSLTTNLAQELSEQLRLVLEPTQASRLKGDFRTGRRINMRKVIPYIASQFRKDKIWLRRTKPSKREYQIALAIDDSSSMADNHSKEMAFESVALISKALTLLESGQLSILSFGESTQVVHKLSEPFTDKSGGKIVQKFQFNQQKTCVAKLVDFATEMLKGSPSRSTESLLAKLLIVVSDGRGIFSEGESVVHQAVRRAKLDNIFMIFVIIDNPASESSILDIRKPIFSGGKISEIKLYMDSFPFPFYVILRDINSLPSVLSDALRQWFEVVSNTDL